MNVNHGSQEERRRRSRKWRKVMMVMVLLGQEQSYLEFWYSARTGDIHL
jgi:hypothetical protein